MNKVLILVITVCITATAKAQEVKMVKITDVEKIIAESKQPTIINFWATWCIPCIEEIPYFLEEVAKNKKDSVSILFVSLDFKESFPAGIISFIKKKKITEPVVWLNETDADYFCPKISSRWSGAIPATLFVNNNTSYTKFSEGQLSHIQLQAAISKMLAKTQ
jgi:thiol-disulfide isomerase/thioredoxin